MGWIQFIQIAKEPSWHDSSLCLIQGLVLSVTSYMAKWWFLHFLLVMKTFFCTTLTQTVTILMPITITDCVCVCKIRQPSYQCSAVTTLPLYVVFWLFGWANRFLYWSLLSIINKKWICVYVCVGIWSGGVGSLWNRVVLTSLKLNLSNWP